ncbi:MAG: NAD-dependent epimerase/dehydratase family protein [Chloroflexota bacterium]
MNILIIGGTRFIGRHLVEAALDSGHHVTLFNRGKTNPGIYPTVEEIHGDRDGGLDDLEGKQWDVVYDINGYFPRIVRQSAEKLRNSVGRYVFVSSVSVYADMVNQTSEADAPLHTLPDPTVEAITSSESYGGLKVLCEQTVTDIYGERGLIVRPGFVVGRYDYTLRLPYLVTRFKRGGERLAGRPEQSVQFIHARDLGDWMVLAAQNALSGAYNLTGNPIPMHSLLDTINAKVNVPNTIIYTSDDFLEAHEVRQIDDLTFWVPKTAEGVMHVTIEKALNTGLTLRGIDTIIEDLVTWNSLDEQVTNAAGSPLGAPTTQAREAELLTAWHSTHPAA